MKSFTSYITEAALGDCYESAFHWILEIPKNAAEKAKVCHGMVNGQGPLEGKKFGHAWGELGGMVIDNSNGNQVAMPKASYYALGKIDESEVYSYPLAKFLSKAAKAKHYGPWDMTGATVDVSSSPPMTEEIPKRANKIGKRKVRIPKDLLSTLKKQ